MLLLGLTQGGFFLGARTDFLQARHKAGLQALLELRQGIRVES